MSVLHRLLNRLIPVAGSAIPLRTLLVRKLLRRFPLGSVDARLRASAFDRPHAMFCLYHAARQAAALGLSRITAVEFGVAGGQGLLLLCRYAEEVQRETGVAIELIGMDAATGLPASTDPRDLLYQWPAGSFEMDVPRLQARLNGRAQLVLGDVAQTTSTLQIPAEAPLGAIIFDLDFYTSTRDAFTIFQQAHTLPRVWCYFDDVAGTADNALTEHLGERAAIAEFNRNHDPLQSHLAQAYAFKYLPPEFWHQQIFVYHRLTHPEYNRCLSPGKHTLAME